MAVFTLKTDESSDMGFLSPIGRQIAWQISTTIHLHFGE